MPVSERCRENFERSVSVDAEIDGRLLRTLTPQILRLRQESHRPITVYVDSIGGDPRIADAIVNLLTAPDADGNCCSVVTVVTRLAASAAANLLAAGDYVVAYPNTTIYFHGLRLVDLPEATFERASSAAKSLRESNETRALILANKVIERFLLLYVTQHLEIQSSLRLPVNTGKTAIELFVSFLQSKISLHARNLCTIALGKYFDLKRVSDYAFTHVDWSHNPSPGEMKCTLLRAILDYKIAQNTDHGQWKFSEDEMETMLADYDVVNDYSGGYGHKHEAAVETMARRMGKFLLSASEVTDLDDLPDQSVQSRDQWLLDKVKPVLQPVWFFTISICRLLQLNENPLTAEDAYWLGIVSEVLGRDWPSFRVIYESAPAT